MPKHYPAKSTLLISVSFTDKIKRHFKYLAKTALQYLKLNVFKSEEFSITTFVHNPDCLRPGTRQRQSTQIPVTSVRKVCPMNLSGKEEENASVPSAWQTFISRSGLF